MEGQVKDCLFIDRLPSSVTVQHDSLGYKLLFSLSRVYALLAPIVFTVLVNVEGQVFGLLLHCRSFTHYLKWPYFIEALPGFVFTSSP